jgi:hypothetical protein
MAKIAKIARIAKICSTREGERRTEILAINFGNS